MKIRLGFVSNSSSASFIIPCSVLTSEQQNKLLNYSEISERLEWDSWRTAMIVDDVSTDKFIRGYTVIDNGDMAEFLCSLGISAMYVVNR